MEPPSPAEPPTPASVWPVRRCPAMPLELTDEERAMLAGHEGEATASAMRILVETAEVMTATSAMNTTAAMLWARPCGADHA